MSCTIVIWITRDKKKKIQPCGRVKFTEAELISHAC